VKRLATRERTEVRTYKVIYELLDNARDSMEALLAPEVVETIGGTLTVKGVFRTLKEQVIAGGEVTSGKVVNNVLVRAHRGDEILGEAEITSLQREKTDSKEVFEGDMCGFNLKTRRKLALEIGDKLEFFTRTLVTRTL
jgi:translation initiation factor IF-2